MSWHNLAIQNLQNLLKSDALYRQCIHAVDVENKKIPCRNSFDTFFAHSFLLGSLQGAQAAYFNLSTRFYIQHEVTSWEWNSGTRAENTERTLMPLVHIFAEEFKPTEALHWSYSFCIFQWPPHLSTPICDTLLLSRERQTLINNYFAPRKFSLQNKKINIQITFKIHTCR